MLVKEWMSENVITAEEDFSIIDAQQLMKEKGVRRLPVLNKKGQLTGIVSDRDIRDASPSKATTLDVHELYYLLSKLTLKEIMTKNPVTISPMDTVEKAAVIMLEKRISGLPVVEGGRLAGMLSQGDVFRVLTSITGVYRGGVLFSFELDDRSGSIKEVADVIRNHGDGRVNSILSSHDTAPEGRRNVHIRVVGIPDDKLEGMIEELKEKFHLRYWVQDELKDVK